MRSETSEIPGSPLRFAWWSSRTSRSWAYAALTCVLLASCLSLSQHYVIRQLTDAAANVAVGTSRSYDNLWFWAFCYPAIVLLSQSTYRGSGFCGMRWITKTSEKVYQDLFAHLSGHSTGYFSDRFAGALSNKISNAASGIESLISTFLWQLLTLLISMIGSLALIFQVNNKLSAVMLFWLILYLSFNLVAVRKLRKHAFSHAERTSELKGKIVDSTTNIDVVQQAGQIEFELAYVNSFVAKKRLAHLKTWTYFEWILVANGVLIASFSLHMLIVAISLVANKGISVGALVMLISILASLKNQMFFIGHVFAQAIRDYGQVQEGLDELLRPHDIVNAPNAQAIEVKSGSISISNMTFAYNEEPIFEDFNLDIPPGQKVGLVGASGVGKSTLVSLILRQYEIDSGNISIDGVSIQDVTLESLRKSIALVPQSTSLFHRTIKENIRYGRLDASDEEVEQAAIKAFADDFIRDYPDGYNTFVGERGVKLSGGQRQRIAIARAIVKNSPILILDEATSALDSESESAIQKALEHLMTDKTVLAIAHRLSTLRAMDRIIVLEKGKIVQDGSHEELANKAGIYQRLWKSQVHGFLPG